MLRNSSWVISPICTVQVFYSDCVGRGKIPQQWENVKKKQGGKKEMAKKQIAGLIWAGQVPEARQLARSNAKPQKIIAHKIWDFPSQKYDFLYISS